MAGKTPKVHYAEDGVATTASPVVQGTDLTTRALRVSFLVIDPPAPTRRASRPPGPTSWSSATRSWAPASSARSSSRSRPGVLRFTLDGRTPRDGDVYDKPIAIGARPAQYPRLRRGRWFRKTADFSFAEFGGKAQVIDPAKPAILVPSKSKKLDSREKTYSGLESAKAGGAVFTNVKPRSARRRRW